MAWPQIEPKIRVGEILTLLLVAVGMIGGWFALQTQVKANTTTIQQTIVLIDEMQDRVECNRETAIRHDPSGTFTHPRRQ